MTWNDILRLDRPQSRATEARERDYIFWMLHARVQQHEWGSVGAALRRLEDLHGFDTLQPALELVGIALGQYLASRPLDETSLIGYERGYLTPGQFLGHMIEVVANLDSSIRHFETHDFQLRTSFEETHFDDFIVGATIARRLGILESRAPDPVTWLSDLARKFRQKLEADGYGELERLSAQARNSAQHGRPLVFAKLVTEVCQARQIRPLATWKHFRKFAQWPDK